ncbi:hypothetical protein [Streptomyces caniscabiei]|uniref:Secreted protein n=1 Tax=Streptomyces caniscabiei TaxID=2746961 RepID=A0ABU4N539_9ACTN|nr:hypothetical protein [Streptomyces caniscabiei]MBE4735517.1 hypothetical protein [Streptomyces caniscabiei]MBE4758130.1 hypothetical protein [Streptomyces caniscabiei]MBE4774755.1 hypothetical protein [Streptomyces caniscabiei]MBE4789513.1 hypothetical protein [Streptomyces caniscabiei]MBE4795935.1 hypothetical protein [Streptomyces caniscabiei]
MRRTAGRSGAGSIVDVPGAGPAAGPVPGPEGAGAPAAGFAPAAPGPVPGAAPAPAPGPAPAPAVAPVAQRLRTEFPFELPRGYVDEAGNVHREGVMRLATARDELIPLRDVRVQENPAYLSVVLLGRVITRLGNLPMVHDGIVENMFASDLAFLQDFYRQVNAEGHTRAAVECPHCSEPFEVELGGSRLGES